MPSSPPEIKALAPRTTTPEYSRAVAIGPVAVNVPAAGLKISAEVVAGVVLPVFGTPPVTNTRPSGSTEAVGCARGALILPVSVNVFVAGLKTSAVEAD